MMKQFSPKLNQFLDANRDRTLTYMRRHYSALDSEKCKDIFQEASIALFNNIATGRYTVTQCSLYSYFLAIINNLSLKTLSRTTHNVSIEVLTSISENDHLNSSYQEGKVNDLLCLCNEQDDDKLVSRMQQVVQDIMNALTGKCKQLLWGHYGDNLPWAVLADMYGLANADVAKSTANRCRHQFKEKFNSVKRKIYGI